VAKISATPLKFEQLSAQAKNKACKDYLTGWFETHPEEKGKVGLNWARSQCVSDDRTLYSEDGTVLDS